jgi:hypothetical protein
MHFNGTARGLDELAYRMANCRMYAVMVGRREELPGAESGDTAAGEVAMWEELWRFVTGDDLNNRRHDIIFGGLRRENAETGGNEQ